MASRQAHNLKNGGSNPPSATNLKGEIVEKLKVMYRKGKGKIVPRVLVKCSCGCKNKLEIYYDRDGLEIGGVNGDIDDWRRILFPMLKEKE